MLRAVIFDLDGTLVESNVDFAALRVRMGFPAGEGILEHLETLPEPARSEAAARVREAEIAGARAAIAMPGARNLLMSLRESQVPTAVVTRNTRGAAELSLECLGVGELPLLTREDCAPKPDPEGPLMLAARWGLKPAEILFVGDFIWDLRTARAAGMPSCLFAPAFQPRPTLESQADHVVRSLSEVRKLL